MSTALITNPGIASTIQDSGRHGVQHMGISPGGAMDPYALRLGQHLLHHTQDEAAIEIPLGVFSIRFSDHRRAVLTGAEAEVLIDGRPTPTHTPFDVRAGETVSIGRVTEGVYCYLHVSGGIETPRHFGSRSTSPRDGIGGLEGRTLQAGDCVPLGEAYTADGRPPVARAAAATPEILTLRFIPGFQIELFPPSAKQRLEQQIFSVSARANRMGVTLQGQPIETGLATLLSEATCAGAIQIPPDGQPIILLADRQTVGGYPKAGAVIQSDCARLAQARPGQNIRLTPCSLAEADRVRWLESNYEQERFR